MNIGYLAPLKDYSGYGEAARHDIAALRAAKVGVSGKLVSYVKEAADFGTLTKTVEDVLACDDPYRIQILHTTPDQFRHYKEQGVFTIGRLFWETDKLPAAFADGCNLCDEIWTGSLANMESARKAGVKVPISIIPQAIETKREWGSPYELGGVEPGRFLFYSIFEWIDRKNPRLLLNAYWKEFKPDENVGLLIKTYFRDFSFVNKKMISNQVAVWKAGYGEETAPVYLYKELMDRPQIMRLHKTGHCFVSAHRGEGWGLPQIEAMLAGNPIISTGYGGFHEYLKDGQDALLLPFTMQPVKGMTHSPVWYTSDQNWAEVSEDDLRQAMRRVYQDQAEAQAMALRGQKKVVKVFNLATVGKTMAARLNEIEASL